MSEKRKSDSVAEREIVIERIVNAPPEQVFAAWTNAEAISQWWGPRGFTTTTQTMRVEPGGAWLCVMHAPDGTDYPNRIIYREVKPFERLIYDHDSGDDHDNEQRFQVTVSFADMGAQTRVVLRMLCATVEQCRKTKEFGAVEGGEQTLQRLDEHLLGRDSFVISRIFVASQARLFEAWSESQHLQNWFAPKGCVVRYKKLKICPGGVGHYSMTTPDGTEIWGRVVYREVFKPHRLVYIQSFADEKENIVRYPLSPAWPLEMLTTIVFEPAADNRTKLTLMWTPLNASEEEWAVFNQGRGGMTQGWGGTLDLLEDYLRIA